MAHLSPAGILRSTITTFVNLLVGVALVAVSAVLLAMLAPDGRLDVDAYKAATPCAAAPAADVAGTAASAECLWTQEFTVSAISMKQTRSESMSAVLTGPDGDRWRTRYSSAGPVLDGLDEGDRVTGTVWRGRLTEIAAGGDSQRTHAYPADMRTRALIGALVMMPSGLLMTALCTWRLSRRRSTPEATPGMVATLGLAYAFFCAGLLSPVAVAGMEEEKAWPVAAVWLPMAALLTAGARYYVKRKRVSADGDGLTGGPPAEGPAHASGAPR
ncbi:hypothetical protein [Actinomadura sp. 7K507]|uniref:hypothetical protein n=1 Tax=Actinomadura sp. 7K507 TaxID=2530365 RepID=UPI0010518948|nr:hypothetical protein [Actinomadura sp. 7K507]TDC83617.1 hypothetical protein E1285_28510 [Actinomadura sp. 7K507]